MAAKKKRRKSSKNNAVRLRAALKRLNKAVKELNACGVHVDTALNRV